MEIVTEFDTPKTLIEDIALPECEPSLHWASKTYRFPCGISISKQLGDEPVHFYPVVRAAHIRHHKEGHSTECELMQRMSYSEDMMSSTLTVWCCHA